MVESYINLIKGGEGEIVEKKSRFIGQIKPVSSEEHAYAFVEEIKKKHYAARHNCFAFSVGVEQPLLRFSDDGEPQGTAGKPILEVITSSGIHNICIVVTRYFGGTLLGTGGLIRAYTDASKEALSHCETKLMERLIPADIRTNYTDIGKLQYILGNHDVKIIDTVYADDVLVKINLRKNEADSIIKELTDATSARAKISTFDEIYG
ncbi:MAG: YigZ family protein [Lachnospiraceae bacterium]|nr:YigZ family protein [Lachnospiraceae bacterium]